MHQSGRPGARATPPTTREIEHDADAEEAPMKREVMLGKLVFAEELLAGIRGEPAEPIREALEHVVAVVRALVESLVESTTERSPQE
jgi:hypothetical protein